MLPWTGHYCCLAHLRSPGYKWRNLVEWVKIKSYYESNQSAQKHLWPFNQDGGSKRDNKHERLKGTTEGQKLMLALATIATQMLRERIKGALA